MKTLSRSDVVMTRPGSMQEYTRFPATMLGWGLLPEPDRRGLPPIEECMRRVEEAHLCNMKFQGRVEFDADWMGMIDYDPNFMDAVCMNLEGQPIVTWWVHRYRGHPPYNYCTNSPLYLNYLLHQVQQVIGAGADMIMLDCVIPTITTVAKGGCFCSICKDGFRKYLAANFSVNEMAKNGIKEIEAFDYQEYLLEQNVSLAKFVEISTGNTRGDIPLLDQYLDFQYCGASDCFKVLKERAYKLNGEAIAFSTNAPFAHPIHSFSVSHMDYFTREIKYAPPQSEIFPSRAWFEFKVAESFGKLVACTACPPDFEHIGDQKIPGFCRLWIAQAFASGHNFMVPARMWTRRIANQPDHWYESNPGDYEPIYEFVSRNRKFIDDYETVAKVALVIDYSEFMKLLWNSSTSSVDAATPKIDSGSGRIPYQHICNSLALQNVPFRLIFFGNDWLEDQLDKHDLRKYERIVKLVKGDVNKKLEHKLEPHRARVVDWDSGMDVLFSNNCPIVPIGASNIVVLPRQHSTDGEAPAVVHLLNLNYDAETDSHQSVKHLKLQIQRSLFGRHISNIYVFVLESDKPIPCDFIESEHNIEVSIPQLMGWAILTIQ